MAVVGRSRRAARAQGQGPGRASLAAGLPAPVQGQARASATPAGPPTASRATSTRTRTSRGTDRGRAQRHHRERRRTARRAGRRRRRFTSETDSEVLRAPDRRSERRPTLEDAVREALTRVVGTYGIAVAGHAPPGPASWPPATAARSCSASATRRCSSPPTSPRWSATPGRSCTWTTASWRPYAPTGSAPSTLDRRATRKEPSVIEAEDGRVRRRGLHALHAQGDPRAARRRRAGAARPAGRAVRHRAPGRAEPGRRARPARSAGSRSSAAARRTTPGRSARSCIEELARIPADAEPASEFRYRNPVVERGHAVRRGEPVRRDLRHPRRRPGAQAQGRPGRSAWSTSVGSAIARECDGGIYLHAGPEIAVASTKALHVHGGGVRPARAAPRPHPRPVARRRPPDRRGLRALPGADRGDPGQQEDRIAELAARVRRRPQHVLHRPGPRLPGRPGGSAEAQGGLLRPRGGLPGQRAQARPARAGQPGAADRRDRARTTSCWTRTCRRWSEIKARRGRVRRRSAHPA